MLTCGNIQFISEDEYIGNSLSAINTNFQELTSLTCEVQQFLDARVNIRTFFYYGPNSPNSTTEFDLQSSRPSNATIERFVNSENGLNLTPISESGDYAWVIYQRTGWASQTIARSGSDRGKVSASFRVRRIGRLIGWVTVSRPWSVSATRNDTTNQNIPIFILYKLKFDATLNPPRYVMISPQPNNRNPLYVRSITASTNNWNRPENWGQYSQWNPA
jgi:hypothetical protein